jgi:hypothetical protein
MDTQLDREEYRLLVLIEQLQQEGRSAREIERAVRDASGRLQREHRRSGRDNGRLGLLSRLLLL